VWGGKEKAGADPSVQTQVGLLAEAKVISSLLISSYVGPLPLMLSLICKIFNHFELLWMAPNKLLYIMHTDMRKGANLVRGHFPEKCGHFL
jgi:hypothetical protein